MNGDIQATSKMSDPIVSHGRGGSGNIGADPTKYVDGEIRREGVQAASGLGPNSTGRGGQGNIGNTEVQTPPQDVIPEEAVRPSSQDNFHVGRGGEGNIHIGKQAPKLQHEGLADKLKRKMFGEKKKKAETVTTTNGTSEAT